MKIVYVVLEYLMSGCYAICANYGIAIILFTAVSKLILFPVSIWVQKNSIKMVKIQPEINWITAKYFGDKEAIAEEQSKLFQREKYHPMASVIPLILQLILLMGVIEAIQRGIGNPAVDMNFLGIDLSLVPNHMGGTLVWVPVAAAVSAWVLCAAQNKSNVLQSEQSKWNKYGMMFFSVGLSLYLGWFVPVGVALYWVASNLFAVLQLYLLNWIIDPRKFIDYQALEESRKELEALGNIGKEQQKRFGSPEAKREKQDYKKFFSIVNKHLVFYSESSGFYKYYQGIITYLLEHTNIVIHYITSDYCDNIFELAKTQDRIRPYYIGEKRLITLMMKMDADIVVMTMPDLENYHIKRSRVRKDIEYIYIPHGMDSLNLTMRKGSMDAFDTVFCVGPHQKEEIRETEAVYGLAPKRLVEWGYTLLYQMRDEYANLPIQENLVKKILIAPSWQPENIVDSCLEQILDNLKGRGYQIIVRPHPQHIRHRREAIERLADKYRQNKEIEIQMDFADNQTVFTADLMITDWSGIAYEYAYTTQKPVLFINTPMKIINPEYQKISTVPLNILLREEIGCALELEELDKIGETAEQLLMQQEFYYEKIGGFVQKYVYHIGTSAEIGAMYIVSQLRKKIQEKKQDKS